LLSWLVLQALFGSWGFRCFNEYYLTGIRWKIHPIPFSTSIPLSIYLVWLAQRVCFNNNMANQSYDWIYNIIIQWMILFLQLLRIILCVSANFERKQANKNVIFILSIKCALLFKRFKHYTAFCITKMHTTAHIQKC
jgi:hypothetical protein